VVRRIVRSSLQFRALVFLAGALIIFLGATRLGDARVDVFPEFAPLFVEVQTEALGLSAAEIEDLVTINLEELLGGTAWLRTIRSKSAPGLSSILLEFEPGTDIMRARQLVQERLMFSYALPNVSKTPVMLNPLSVTSRTMMIGISSKHLSLTDLSVLTRFTIKPRLLGVPGVANVAVWGQRLRQLQVQVDPDHLAANDVTLDQVIKSAGNSMWFSPLSYLEASTPGTGGWIDTPTQRLAIRHTQPISMPADLARVTVEGTQLSLGDVANVVEGYPPLIGDAIVNGGPGLLLVVEKLPQSDARDVIRGVEAALESLRPGLARVEIESSLFRSSNFVDRAISNVSKAVLMGAALLVLALAFLFYEWRAAVISAVAILLSALTAALVLYLTKSTINTMIIAGFMAALFVVVDDAIADVERIQRHLRRSRAEHTGKSVGTVILEALAETRAPIVYATLIVALSVVPVFFLVGVPKAFFAPLASSYLLALLVSLIVAMTATPALASVLLRTEPRDDREPPLTRWLKHHYEAALLRLANEPRKALLAAGAVVLAGFAVWPLLGQSVVPSLRLLPQFNESDVQITWKGAPGTSYTEMQRIMTLASGELRSIPGVRSVAAHVGRAVTGDQIVGIESAQVWVSIDPTANHDATLAAITETIDGHPGLKHEVQTYLRGTVRQVFTEKGEAITVRIQGPEREGLLREAEKVKQALSGIEGLVDLHVDGQVAEPQIEVKVDLAAAGKFGLKPGDVRRAAATAFAGLEVGSLFEQQKVFEVVVWSSPENRDSLTDVRELLIDTPDGGRVRLGSVADVRVVPTPSVIEREGISRFIDVVAGVRGRDISPVAADVERRLEGLQFPLEYYPVVLTEPVEREGAQRPILYAALAALIGIFLLLQACFRSWRLASAAFVAVLATLVGPVIAVHVTGNTVLLGSLVGFFAVVAIAARHCIALIRHFQLLELREGKSFGLALVRRGVREQLAPILMTSAASILALLPFVLYGNIAGLEIVHPMAVVVLGGLVTSTLVNLFIVPLSYLTFGARAEPEMRFDEGDLKSASHVA